MSTVCFAYFSIGYPTIQALLGRLLTTRNVLHLTDGATLMLEASGTARSGGVRGHFARIGLCSNVYIQDSIEQARR